MFINLGGVLGVGKTTVTKEIEKFALRENFGLERVIGVPILCKLAGVASAAELRALPEDVRKKLRPEMYRQLYAEDRADMKKIRLGDGHFCMFDINAEYYGVREIQPGDREQMLAIAVLTASPESILQRRLKDASKRRDRQFDLGFIQYEQTLELSVAQQQANELGIPLKIIGNSDEEPTKVTIGGEKCTTEIELLENLRASGELYDQIKAWTKLIK